MAAGQGFKTFVTGEVLTAADVNGYLMQGVLVFATEAARNAAITLPQEGQFAFTKDTNSTWYYDGAAWVASGASGDVTGVTAGNGISVTNPTGPVPTVAIDTAVTVDKTTAQTLTNKTLTSPALTTPTISTLTTNGDLLYGTGSGAISRIGIGSTSQVLTVTGGVPAWATPASGGGMTLLSTTSLTGASVTISSISGSYKNLYIVLQGIYYATSGGDTYMRLNGDTAANYSYGAFGMVGGVFNGDQSNATNQVLLHKSGGATSATLNKINGAVTINRYTETTIVNGLSNATGYTHTTSRQYSRTTPFLYDCSAAITSITFYGDYNFSDGTVYIYGVS